VTPREIAAERGQVIHVARLSLLVLSSLSFLKRRARSVREWQEISGIRR
jgi:hypothetical protein